MKNVKTLIDETYEFFDELLGSMVPGVYFCSYFVFCLFAVVFTLCGNFELFKDHKYIAVCFFVIAYIVGTMCRRSNLREPDNISAKHVYFNSVPRDDNDFAFHPMITDKQFEELIASIRAEKDQDRINVEWNDDILERRKKSRRIRLKFRNHVLFLKRNKKEFQEELLAKPYVQNYIYQKLKERKEAIENDSSANKAEIGRIDDFIKKHNLKESCEIYVDYPYSNLKNYLNDRKMYKLAKLVKWKFGDHKKTAMSKSVICNMKLYIKHNSPRDYEYLQKMEAHIRFMNSMWYVNKRISAISFASLLGSVFMGVLIILLRYFDGFGKRLPSAAFSVCLTLKETLEKVFSSAFRSEFNWEKLLGAFMFVAIISFGYRYLSRVIINTMKNNFHYQRVREVVTILYLYNLLEEEAERNRQKKSSEAVNIGRFIIK